MTAGRDGHGTTCAGGLGSGGESERGWSARMSQARSRCRFRVCPEAVVILVSNPVDVLTRIAIEASTRPPHLIFGCGTVLDGARLRHQLGKLLDVDEDSVHAYVIGEHGTARFRSGRARPWERSGSSNTAFPTAPRCHRSSTIWRRRSAAGDEHPRAQGIHHLWRGGGGDGSPDRARHRPR